VGEKIDVPRSKVLEVLGLPPNVDDATLKSALEQAIATQELRRSGAARASQEHALEAEDRRIVQAAVDAGKIGPQRAQFWMGALKSDRAANRALLASLAPDLPPQPVHAAAPTTAAPKTPDARTQAAFNQLATEAAAATKPTNFEILEFGRPPSQWTDTERLDDALHRLTRGHAGHPGPESASGLSDPNAPRLINDGPDAAHWAPYIGTDL